jgi:hypothetical protein
MLWSELDDKNGAFVGVAAALKLPITMSPMSNMFDGAAGSSPYTASVADSSTKVIQCDTRQRGKQEVY